MLFVSPFADTFSIIKLNSPACNSRPERFFVPLIITSTGSGLYSLVNVNEPAIVVVVATCAVPSTFPFAVTVTIATWVSFSILGISPATSLTLNSYSTVSFAKIPVN